MKERLQKILSARGVSSRREAENLITSGRVFVNGEMAILGQSADPVLDEITVDGVYIPKQEKNVYIMLNKPRGYVTTLKDERGRPIVSDLIKGIGVRLYPVGRLDMDSEGLLILTNDGELTNAITHPSNEKTKTYHVYLKGDMKSALDPLQKSMLIDGYSIRPAQVEIIRKTADGGVLAITIHEGRNRQIRKMCAQCGLEVKRLIRVSEGGIKLNGLKTGEWRHLTEQEIAALKCTNHCKNECAIQ